MVTGLHRIFEGPVRDFLHINFVWKMYCTILVTYEEFCLHSARTHKVLLTQSPLVRGTLETLQNKNGKILPNLPQQRQFY